MRIQNALTNHDPKRDAHERRLRERQELRDRSKEVVKNWDNTIEGQRQKKLKVDDNVIKCGFIGYSQILDL